MTSKRFEAVHIVGNCWHVQGPGPRLFGTFSEVEAKVVAQALSAAAHLSARTSGRTTRATCSITLDVAEGSPWVTLAPEERVEEKSPQEVNSEPSQTCACGKKRTKTDECWMVQCGLISKPPHGCIIRNLNASEKEEE